MNQSQSKTIRYAIAGFCGLALLMLLGWLILRKAPPASDRPPAMAATAAPRARRDELLFTPDIEAPQETPTNQVAESATIPTNAATIYRQAFALFDTLSQTQKDLVANWRTNVDSSVAAELCEKIQPICDLMHQAAAVSNCDWGLEQPIVFSTLLPHLNPCRNLARAAVWSVAHCRTSDPSAAVEDLVAASRLGQNASPPTLIGHLVHLAIQGIVIDSTTEHASLLGGQGDTRLMGLFNDASYDEGLRHAFELEADMLNREIDRLVALPPEEAMHDLMTINEGNSSQIQAMGLAQAIADMRQAVELRREYGQALGLPEADYRKWLSSLDEAGKTNPFVEVLVTYLGRAVDKTQAMTVRDAMAVAGLAVMRDGPAALQSHPDPATGQPFVYTQTADGFELESSFPVLGKPMKLTFK